MIAIDYYLEQVGNISLYQDKSDGFWTVSENRIWLPGFYSSKDAALLACKVDAESLQALVEQHMPISTQQLMLLINL